MYATSYNLIPMISSDTYLSCIIIHVTYSIISSTEYQTPPFLAYIDRYTSTSVFYEGLCSYILISPWTWYV